MARLIPQPMAPSTSQSPSPTAVDVYLSAGSNLDPARHLTFACRELAKRFGRLATSAVYRNAPVGFSGDDFLNLVVQFRTAEAPNAIVDELERLHTACGRVRGATRFAPRTLDLDLLLYGDAILPDAPFRVPRADILKYGFVLRPLAELAPTLRHPVSGETMAALWAVFAAGVGQDQPQLERVADLDLEGRET